MKETVLIFLAPGFEEIEALAQVDILRRGEVNVMMVAVSDSLIVKGAHNIPVEADIKMADLPSDSEPLAIVLPGGMPGASNLFADKKLIELLIKQNSKGKLIAAICASPGVVLAQSGILKGHKATAYPSFESYFDDTMTHSTEGVVSDGNIITAQGPAFSIAFGLAILASLKGEKIAKEVASGMLV